MSYDIFFQRLRPGVTREEANRRLASQEPEEIDYESIFETEPAAGTEEERRRFQAARAALTEAMGNPHVFEAGNKVELTDEEWGIQVTLLPKETSISISYWHKGERAEEAYKRLFLLAQIIERETDAFGFDPQLGRLLDPDKDLEEVLAENRDVMEKMDVILKSNGLGCTLILLAVVLLAAVIALLLWL